MISITEKENCVACGACFNKCPVKCIKMEIDSEGFLYPNVDNISCINCHSCERICPINNFEFNLTDTNYPKTYSAVNKNSKALLSSSSGGVFQKLASWVIDNGGVVVGAAFTGAYEVEHIIIKNLKDIELIQSSKYVQSNIRHTLSQVKDILLEERYVLYSGTPCQIAGLRKYLENDYEMLITVDIVCHGVPSPGVWKRYIDEIEGDKKIEHINFRSKRKIGAYGLEVLFTDGEFFFNSVLDNPYMKGFISNLYLRPSCYHCKFKGKNRIGDISLGDLWRADKVLPEADKHEYNSLVIINTEKGNKIFEDIREFLYVNECCYDKAIQYNNSIIESSVYNPKREEFFVRFQATDIEVVRLLQLFTKETISKKFISLLKRVIKKVIFE